MLNLIPFTSKIIWKNVKKHGPNLCEIYYLLNGLNVAFYVIEYQFCKNVDDDVMYLAGDSL